MRRLIFTVCLAGLLVPVMAQAGQGMRSGRALAAKVMATTVRLDPGAINSGVVGSPKSVCVTDRSVTVRYRDRNGKKHFLGKDTTDAKGGFVAVGGSPKGPFPYKVQAVVAAVTRTSAGGTFACKGAASKVRLFHPA